MVPPKRFHLIKHINLSTGSESHNDLLECMKIAGEIPRLESVLLIQKRNTNTQVQADLFQRMVELLGGSKARVVGV